MRLTILLRLPGLVLALIWGLGHHALLGQDATIPGDATSPYPTLHNLAVEWPFEGDANSNGVVTVEYRRADETGWHQAMPLMRVPGRLWSENGPGRPVNREHRWVSKHSGSIFDLRADTDYEIALTLTDPDGGSTRRTLQARTRPVPRASPAARMVRVHPGNFHAAASAARPGDVFLLTPGNYGYFAPTQNGEAGRPIVFRAEPDGVFDQTTTHLGAALFEGISLQNRRHVYLEGLFSSDTIDLFNADSCVVRRCRIHAPFGIISAYSGNLARKWAPRVAARLQPPATPALWDTLDRQSLPPGAAPRPHATNCYVADNVVIGMTEWADEAMGVFGKNMGEGIEVTGPGNVICHNRVSGFRDCISTLEDRYAVNQVCIDIHNNDISCGPDDGIEADFTMGNCRIMRNRITNCFMGVSAQPSLGGPTYFVRNVMYNIIHSPYKFMRRSRGNIVLHNTVVKTGDGTGCQTRNLEDVMSDSVFLNNIGIGGGGIGEFGKDRRYGNGTGSAAYFPSADSSCRFDYNGYGTEGFPFRGVIGGQRFDSVESLRTLTSERHGVQLTLGIFEHRVVIPDPALREWSPPDFRLKTGSAAMDAAVVLPNINDAFTGRAPDLGAHEIGQDSPIYGPRPLGVAE